MSTKLVTRVLLVEDEAADAMFIKTLLQGTSLGYFEIIVVGKIAAAIEYSGNNAVDVVLLDLSLPDSFGIETIQTFRQSLPHLPVVVLTGLDANHMGIKSIGLGCQDYLIKGDNDGNGIARAALYAIERKRLEQELLYTREQYRLAEERYRMLVNALPDAILICNAKQVLLVNDAAKKLCCGAVENLQEYRLVDLVTPQHASQVSGLIENVLKGTHTLERVELQLHTCDGQTIDAEVVMLPFNHDGTSAVEVVIHDLAVRRDADHYRTLATTVFEGSAEAMLLTDANVQIRTVNAAFTNITQYSVEDVIGKNPSMLSSRRHQIEFYRDMWDKILTVGCWSGDIWNRRKDGEIYVQHLAISVIRNRNGVIENFVGVFSDVTLERQLEDKVRYMALHDALTGLPNRILLADRMEQAITQARRYNNNLAVLFLDLDGFKIINDRHGHHIGDEVLRQVSQRLQACVREVDTVARVGGDEFVVVLADNVTNAGTIRIAQAILASIREPINTEAGQVSVGTSIGIAIFPKNGDNNATLQANADTAMYAAKNSGKGKVCFFDDVCREVPL